MSDYVNKIAPEHSRTSCDDDDLYNAAYGLDDFDGRGRCYRCTLLMAQAKARIEDAAAPAAPAADDDDIVLNANAQEILSQCIGAHAYVLGVLANGRPDLAFIEAKKWVDAFKKAAAQMEQGQILNWSGPVTVVK